MARTSGMKRDLILICATVSSIISLTLGQSTSTEDQYLNPHNAARAELNQNIPNLSWNTTLASFATDWANNRATAGDNCNLIHSEKSKNEVGENIYWSSGQSTPGNATASWVSEKQFYDYASNSCAAGQVCGHYLQVVWRNTTTVGCGSATCSGGGTFVVCNYNPGKVGEKPY